MKPIIKILVGLLLCLVLVSSASASEVNDPVAHWKLDEGNDIIAFDSMGNYDGNITGADWTEYGKINSALHFDAGDYVLIPGLIPGNHGTFAAWVKSDVAIHSSTPKKYNTIIWSNRSQIFLGSSVVGYEGQIRFMISPSPGQYSILHSNKNSWNAGQWYHITGTWDGVTQAVYVDGVLDKSQTQTYSGGWGTTYIGGVSGTPGYSFDGVIDDAYFYDRALSAEEVQQLYQQEPNEPEPNEPNLPKTFHVPADYQTIQSAIDAAVDGDTVIVAPGTYTGLGNRDIDFKGKAITVRSESCPENCIIDCNGSQAEPHSGFYFHTGEDANSIVDGLSVTNGYANYGGGIHCDGSSPTIKNCIIADNSAKYGGGIYCYYDSNPILTNCTVSRNSASERLGGGGGMYNYYSSPKLMNCVFGDNSAERGLGGGIYNYHSNSTLTDCTFRDNTAAGGGGLSNEDSNSLVINCTFTSNSAYFGGGILNNGGSPKITNCSIKGNSAILDDSYGGGIYCQGGKSIITSCIITDNSADLGGGIYCNGDDTITSCKISGNEAHRSGGGIFCYFRNPTINNSTISDNTALRYGGGMSCQGSSPIITNSILWGNTAELGGEQIALFGYRSQSNYYPSTLTISYSDTEDGFAKIYIETGSSVIWKLGNIDVDPCFIDADANDYHLSTASPCINTGDPNFISEPNETDIDGLPRIIGGRVDMGAYEFNHQPVAIAGPNQVAYAWMDGFADVNLDGSASFDDDNDILDFYWSWTINGSNYEANGVNPKIKLPIGRHTIELVVDDGIDLSEPSYCTITVIKAVRGKLLLNPQVIQIKSCGKWIIATLFILPVPGEQINKEQPLRLYPLGIEAQYQRFYKYGIFQHGPSFAVAFFDKQQVVDALGLGTTKISVVGEFLSGRYFFGSDNIKIISPKPPNHWRW